MNLLRVRVISQARRPYYYYNLTFFYRDEARKRSPWCQHRIFRRSNLNFIYKRARYFRQSCRNGWAPEPRSQAGKILHLLRARRRIYHQCGAMLIELKPGPSRLPFNELEDKKLYASSIIRRAQNELFQHCSEYFACYPDAKSVIAIGTGVHFGIR